MIDFTEKAREIAVACAKKKPESYYEEPFHPHQWVLDAVLFGIKAGLEMAAEQDEKEETKWRKLYGDDYKHSAYMHRELADSIEVK